MGTLSLILATYYVAISITKLHGPLGWCERLRHAVWRRRGFVQVEDAWLRGEESLEDDWVAQGMRCPLCVSLYASVVLAALASTGAGVGIVDILAAAGGASLLFSLGRYW